MTAREHSGRLRNAKIENRQLTRASLSKRDEKCGDEQVNHASGSASRDFLKRIMVQTEQLKMPAEILHTIPNAMNYIWRQVCNKLIVFSLSIHINSSM